MFLVSLPFFPWHSADEANDQAVKYLKICVSSYYNYLELVLCVRVHVHEASKVVVQCACIYGHT